MSARHPVSRVACREGNKEKGSNMKEEARGTVRTRMAMIIALAVVAVLSFGMLAACSSGSGSGSSGGSSAPADETTMTTKTLVKTATNEMTLVDWDVSAADSPLTVSSDDAKYADYVDALREITGFDIESLTMQVSIVEVAGAEIAATHENVTDNTYTIENLDAVVDGKTITYTKGDFK